MQTINLDGLPPRARVELIDFYASLLEKHASSELPGTGAGETSRWSKIAQRVHEDTRYPGGWSEPLKQDMGDFRESYANKSVACQQATRNILQLAKESRAASDSPRWTRESLHER